MVAWIALKKRWIQVFFWNFNNFDSQFDFEMFVMALLPNINFLDQKIKTSNTQEILT